MAANMAKEGEGPTVNLLVNGDETDEKTDQNEDIEASNDALRKNKSRFKVARVDFAAEPVYSDREDSPPGDNCQTDGAPCVTENGGAGRGVPGNPQATPPCSPNASENQTDPSNSVSYTYTDTQALKTFGRNTLETLPHLDHYRNLLSATGAMRKRPTLLELHEYDNDGEDQQEGQNGHVPVKSSIPVEEVKVAITAPKFGWIKGVLVRCLLNIFGVMLFLRLSWVVGQSGIGLSTLVVLLSAVVTSITALSMAAICTNGEVKGGGAYFMISRSLGPEFGGAIGLIFSVANAVAVAMYVVGFAETIRDILKNYDMLMVDELNDVRIIGALCVVVLLGVAMVGMEWEARAQLVLLGVLVVAIVNFIIGTFLFPSEDKRSKGFVGYKDYVVVDNMGPDFRDGHSFFSVFSIFFPAATGILAGANISGDLADAQRAIPKGTLLSILISTITYIAMAWLAGSCVVRDAYGPVMAAMDPDVNGSLANGTDAMLAFVLANDSSPQGASWIYAEAGSNGTYVESQFCVPGNCTYGLQNDMQVMQLVSLFGPITIAGIISATLSSALASLVSAPKVFQAVCKDKIFPGIHVFAKGYGKNDEPWRAYVLAFFIAFGFVCIGQLNDIAPLISNFFLMSYALINYSCFDASLAKSPGWRPAFRYYSMWLSLLGAVICLAVMFIINWWSALLTFACVTALYIYVHYRKPDINWGSSTQAHVYRNALQHTLKLVSVLEHVKNFRPQILVMTGFPSDRQILVDFASNITKNVSLMVCGHIIKGDPNEKLKDVRSSSKVAYDWLTKRKSRAFYNAVTARSMRGGCQALLQCAGMGKLKPNTLMMGFKSDWKTANPVDVEDYFNVIHDTFDLHYGVGILRVRGGFDFSHLTQPVYTCDATPVEPDDPSDGVADELVERMKIQLGDDDDSDSEEIPDEEEEEVETEAKESCLDDPKQNLSAEINKNILKDLNQFHRGQKKGTIDVWWLFDDGGLTLLIPYLLSTKKYWKNCRLRVFMPGTKKMELDRDQRNMATMLSKFRIEYSSMTVVPDINKKPHHQNSEEFQKLLEGWTLDQEAGETEETHPWKISEEAMLAQQDKTNRHIRLRELLLQYSSDANLIVMSLPIPRRGLTSSGLYMAWMDTLTRDMPPTLLLRGNHDSVLTFYS